MKPTETACPACGGTGTVRDEERHATSTCFVCRGTGLVLAVKATVERWKRGW